MTDSKKITIRSMRADDFDAVVAIDTKVLGAPRQEYYRQKFEKMFRSNDFVPASLVAEQGGVVVGFVMGEVYIGEYGINQDGATLDTIGVDPDCRRSGIGGELIRALFDHLKSLGVQRVQTLVKQDDKRLSQFFRANRFLPSQTINLERDL